MLRDMYRTGLLEFIIPEMSHARCLLQFNQYHSYTVDEHTLHVECPVQHDHIAAFPTFQAPQFRFAAGYPRRRE